MCGPDKVCPWMLTALARSKTFRWQDIENMTTGAIRSVLVIRLPHQRQHEVIACPVCGGRASKAFRDKVPSDDGPTEE